VSKVDKHIFIDNFRHVGGSYQNFPKFIDAKVVEQWSEPSPDPLTSGKEYVKTEDGRVFWRYDCYTPTSPYGYEEMKIQ